MRASTATCLLGLLGTSIAAGETPELTLQQFLERMRADLARMPDFACTQTVQRFSRALSERSWEALDTIRLEVGFVGGRELYARAGELSFSDRPLVNIIGRGAISTGQFASFARHVFVTSRTEFTFRRESERDGKRTFEYDFDVPGERSSYRLRAGTAEATVPFQGTFWVDSENLDLVRLEIQPYDIPNQLGLAEAPSSLDYSRIAVGAESPLLPVAATFSTVASDGIETLNRTTLTGCRRYTTESAVVFPPADGEGEADRASTQPLAPKLASGTTLELSLSAPVDPASATVGDPVHATLVRAIKNGERILISERSRVSGRLTRLQKQSTPFLVYDVALEFDSIDTPAGPLSFTATMESAGPAPGLILQSRRMDPTFTRKRKARLEILVHEVQRGQGILTWDARRGPVPQGLRMRWRVDRDSGEQK